MTNLIIIRDIGGNKITSFHYDDYDNNEKIILKFEESLSKTEIKDNCLTNNYIIVLINGCQDYYINFIYLQNNKLHFSKYKIFNDKLINNNEYQLICMNVSIEIDFNFLNYVLFIDYINNEYIYIFMNLKYYENKYLKYFLLNINVNIFEYLSTELQKNKEIILLIIKKKYYLLDDVFKKCFSSNELKNDEEFIFNVIKQNGNVLEYLEEKFKNNKQLVLEAIKQNPYSIQYASIEILADKKIMLEAIKLCGSVLKYASEDLKNDKQIVLTAIQQNGNALIYASKQLNKDKELVIEAVKKVGYILYHVYPEFLEDREVVLNAVKQNGLALKYISSKKLIEDKEIVLNAVKQNYLAYNYISSNKLKYDKEILVVAFRKNIINKLISYLFIKIFWYVSYNCIYLLFFINL